MKFVNLSNHPSEGWSEEQKAEARLLGDGHIIDMPFPAVPPDDGPLEVDMIADQVMQQLHGKIANHDAYIMVQGESTLTTALVAVMQFASRADRRWGKITPVAATQNRVVETNEDGSTTRPRFEFVQFRLYTGVYSWDRLDKLT